MASAATPHRMCVFQPFLRFYMPLRRAEDAARAALFFQPFLEILRSRAQIFLRALGNCLSTLLEILHPKNPNIQIKIRGILSTLLEILLFATKVAYPIADALFQPFLRFYRDVLRISLPHGLRQVLFQPFLRFYVSMPPIYADGVISATFNPS